MYTIIPYISSTMKSNKSDVQTYSINNIQSVELINDQLIKDAK